MAISEVEHESVQRPACAAAELAEFGAAGGGAGAANASAAAAAAAAPAAAAPHPKI